MQLELYLMFLACLAANKEKNNFNALAKNLYYFQNLGHGFMLKIPQISALKFLQNIFK